MTLKPTSVLKNVYVVNMHCYTSEANQLQIMLSILKFMINYEANRAIITAEFKLFY